MPATFHKTVSKKFQRLYTRIFFSKFQKDRINKLQNKSEGNWFFIFQIGQGQLIKLAFIHLRVWFVKACKKVTQSTNKIINYN